MARGLPRGRTDAVLWLEGLPALEEHAAAWAQLADRHWSPFMRLEWLGPWVRAFAPDGTLRTATLWRGDELVAALPLLVGRRSASAPANVHTPVFEPLGTTSCVARDVLEAALAEHDRLSLWGLPLEPDGAPPLLRDPGSHLVHVRPWLTSPIVDLHERRRSKSLAKLLRRLQRSADVELRVLEAPADVRGALAAFGALEVTGWKGRTRTAIALGRDTERLYTEMAERFARQGALLLSSLAIDGRLAAFEINISHANRIWGVKCAYDERFASSSPGNLLLHATLEEATARGYDAFEMLGDTDPTKRRFATDERRVGIVHVGRRTPAGLARHAYHSALRPRLRAAFAVAGGHHVRRRARRLTTG